MNKMMNKKLIWWEVSSAIFILIMGFIFLFAFDWLNEWKPIAFLFAVNESIWEHCKIGFFPALIFSIFQYFFNKRNSNNFVIARAIQLLLFPILIIVLFYSYTGIIGSDFFVLDILIFVITIVFTQIISYQIQKLERFSFKAVCTTVVVVLLFIFAFIIMTYNPKHIPLFMDQQTHTYGIHTNGLENNRPLY